MKTPRGYRKKYFTLAAIQAMVCQCKLRALVSRVVVMGLLSVGLHGQQSDDEELLEDPPDTLLASLVVSSASSSYVVSSRPCACNGFFARRAKCTLFLTSFLRKICPCRKTKSGLSPPPSYVKSNNISSQ